MEYIEVYKEDIPYEFTISLDKTYKFLLEYNTLGDFFTIKVYYNDELLAIDKVVYGQILFSNFKHKLLSSIDIVPFSFDDEVRVNWDNFGDNVLLLVGRSEDI